MASSSDSGLDIQAGFLYVGLSAIIGLTLSAAQNGVEIRHIAGNSLWIGGQSLSLTAGLTLNGYLAPTTPVTISDYRGTVYFAAQGATVTLTFFKKIT